MVVRKKTEAKQRARIKADLEPRLDRIGPLSAEDRKRQLFEWNRTEADYDLKRFFPQLFEDWVKRAPDNIAVSLRNRSVTYAWLDDRANRLAHYLVERGVGREKLVGVCLRPSIEMVIAVLGILKAGAGYPTAGSGLPRRSA